MRSTTKTVKRVLQVRRGVPPHWVGDGFHVRTLLSYDEAPAAVSPFLLLDHAAPREFAPAARPRGVGEHPHRGFETVTIAYQGEVEHRDSTGATGRIGAGDVQWMTAGAGVVHEEFHGAEFTRTGGTFEMVQLWVNLPARLKLTPPRYRAIRASEIPTVALPGDAGQARVIAGDLLGARGPAETFSPVGVHDLRLRAGRAVDLDLPDGHTAVVLALRGRVRLNGTDELAPAELAVLAQQGDALRLDVLEDTTALLLTGAPLGEPVVGYGPFVMNTADEIRQAFADFQAGRLARR
ncbi:MAG: pirin family protein [Planctomycetes bacterium]|nr:pirin family protein [Planctomycetota bacterium]